MKHHHSTYYVLFFLIGFCFFASSLHAEYATYYSTRSRGKTIAALLDQMGKNGFRFSVRKTYNEKRDGKLGFQLWLYPGRKYCEMIFFEGKGGRGSYVRIFTQDARDALRFRRVLSGKMKMREEGVIRKSGSKKDQRPWPKPR